jgi:hypothetical protein
MTSREVKERGLYSSPLGDLESPFLDEKLFVRESEPDREAHLGVLHAENPFLGAFEPVRMEPRSPSPGAARELKDDRSLVGETLAFEEEELAPAGFDLGGGEQELEDGPADEEPAEWAMEWADDESGSPLTGTEEPEREAALEYDTPTMTQAISDAVDQKDWPRVLELALQVGWHDENQLTNLLFYSRHPELDRRKLEPKKNKEDRKLAQEWSQILFKEVKPAIEKAAEDGNLEVSGSFVAERDPQLSGDKGRKFKEIVAWAAKEVDIDPGFLAAVLLAEVGSASPYLSLGEVSSFFTGTDDFFAERAQLRANVPAFTQVHFDEKKRTTNINEHGREVITIRYKTGKDAALATGVYLKYGEIKLRRAAQKNGGDFDKLPVATQFVLVRIAMAAGHGGISPDGDLIRFKKKGDKLVRAKPGETGGILLGVATSLDRVLKGEDVLVRNWEPRKDPRNDSHITHRNATILASQAMHLGDWFFRAQPLGVQPELGEPEAFAEETAEPEYEYQVAADKLLADAFVLDNDGKRYFDTFPQLGDLFVQKATVLTPSHFESLMDHMLASNQKNFVIDAHGDPSGLSMELASGTEISAKKKSLFILRGIEHIRTLMRLADESNSIWGRASGTYLDRWRRVVETLHSKTWQKMMSDTWPAMPQVSDVDAARSIVQSRLTALVNSLFPGKIANKQERVDRLIKKMLLLQAKGFRQIQFRACNIGKDPVALYEFRKFFGADHLCGPDVRSGIGSVAPDISRGGVDRLAKIRLTQQYDLASGRFAILIRISDHKFKAFCAADTPDAVMEWVAAHIMAKSRYRKGTLSIHFLQSEPRVFALDKDYAAHIKCRFSLWEGAVRAHELEDEVAHSDEEYEPDKGVAGEQETGGQPKETLDSDSRESGEIEAEDEAELEQPVY